MKIKALVDVNVSGLPTFNADEEYFVDDELGSALIARGQAVLALVETPMITKSNDASEENEDAEKE
jgi:hypothetical protein